MQESCAEAMAAVRACQGEAECGRAAVGLTLCMGGLLCKEEVGGWVGGLRRGSEWRVGD